MSAWFFFCSHLVYDYHHEAQQVRWSNPKIIEFLFSTLPKICVRGICGTDTKKSSKSLESPQLLSLMVVYLKIIYATKSLKAFFFLQIQF